MVKPEVKKFAEAIARAEGFYSKTASDKPNIPQACNNPGDLKLGDLGHGMKNGITIFPTPEAGWRALYTQCEKILGYKVSHAGYKPTMTVLQVAAKYVGMSDPDSPNWAANVARALGISVNDTLNTYLRQEVQE